MLVFKSFLNLTTNTIKMINRVTVITNTETPASENMIV